MPQVRLVAGNKTTCTLYLFMLGFRAFAVHESMYFESMPDSALFTQGIVRV